MEKVLLQQALHGYSNGHRALSGSKKLDGRDAKTLLIMSDVSGPGAQLPEDGYLTGYPLFECGYFAFAKTWPAPEMPRPGCVWTHTLLIDFSDLASISDLRVLNGFFHRPDQNDLTRYSEPIHLAESEPSNPSTLNSLWACSLTAGLYGLPAKKILIQPSSVGALDELVISLWSQQWPKLRRSFRFCTFAVSDRIVDGAQFDLQLLPPDGRNMQVRFAGAALVPLQQPQLTQDWIRAAVDDLEGKLDVGFRKFLRQTGSDFENGRSAFAPLCDLYTALKRNDITLIKRLLSGALEGGRSTLTYAITSLKDHLNDFDDELIELVLANLNLLSKGSADEISWHLGTWLWTRRQDLISSYLVNQDSIEGRAVMRALLDSDTKNVIGWVRLQPKNLAAILPFRSDLLSDCEFWSISVDASETAMRYIAANPSIELPALTGAVSSHRDSLPNAALQHIGAARVLRTLLAISESLAPSLFDLENWFNASASPLAIADVLSSETQWSTQSLSTLARQVDPRDVPNAQGRDPWLVAIEHSKGSLRDMYLDAFLLARGLSYCSVNAEQLIVSCFERVVMAAYTGELSEECWSLLKNYARLPWYISKKIGDADLIALAVVNIFVYRRSPPSAFNSLVANDSLFDRLLELADLSYNSRPYLKRVETFLSTNEGDQNNSRLDRLRRKLNI